MKPVDFDYERPTTVAEALQLLAGPERPVKVLAGGQSLIPLLVSRALRPARVVDIGHIPELAYLRADAGWLRIGATTRQADCAESPLTRELCPLLAEAIGWIATPQVRNLGTVVGSLAQRNAISQIPTVATALGGRLLVIGPQGRREVEAEEFVNPASAATLQPEELVLEASFPRQAPAERWGFVEVQRRHVHYAIVGVAVSFACDDQGTVIRARIAASGLAACPVRLRGVEAKLVGSAANEAGFRAAAELAGADPAVEPVDDLLGTVAYKREVAPALIRRALRRAWTRGA